MYSTCPSIPGTDHVQTGYRRRASMQAPDLAQNASLACRKRSRGIVLVAMPSHELTYQTVRNGWLWICNLGHLSHSASASWLRQPARPCSSTASPATSSSAASGVRGRRHTRRACLWRSKFGRFRSSRWVLDERGIRRPRFPSQHAREMAKGEAALQDTHMKVVSPSSSFGGLSRAVPACSS